MFSFLLASGSKEEKEENVDSGVSADKSESTSSEDRATTAVEAPINNEVVTVAPSSSNVRAILLNIRHPRRSRFYRKRKTPDRDSDSDSSRDSDDLSAEEVPDRRENISTDGDSATEDFSVSVSV